MPDLELGDADLTLDHVEALLRADREGTVRLGEDARRRVAHARATVEKLLGSGRTYYGINTGFGKLARTRIPDDQIEALQANLVRSHAAGVGDPMPGDEARLILLLRANALARGYSGCRPEILDMLLALWNRGVEPLVPSQGSVGASGDLAPLAHVASILLGEGEVRLDGEVVPAARALAACGLSPLVLQAKEGLALLNGTQALAATGALACLEARRVLKTADLAGALSLEGIKGTASAFDRRFFLIRPHPGQAEVAANLRRLLQGSRILASHRDCGKVQDPYSFRCMPQVHGPVRGIVRRACETIEIEANAVTDNPLVFADTEEILSGGNFHGEPVALAMDGLAAGMAVLGGIAERRVENLVNPDLSGLPAFLARDPGLDSGLMIAQVTAAALASENKTLAHPASADSIPTSANKEDFVCMGALAARKARQAVRNTAGILAVELLAAAQAIEFHRPLRSSDAIEELHHAIRRRSPKLAGDRRLSEDLMRLQADVLSGCILHEVEATAGTIE